MTPPHEQIKNGSALKFFKEYWFVVALIFSLAVIWANTERDISFNTVTNEAQGAAIIQNTSDLRVLDKQYTEDISIIKTELKFIRETLK